MLFFELKLCIVNQLEVLYKTLIKIDSLQQQDPFEDVYGLYVRERKVQSSHYAGCRTVPLYRAYKHCTKGRQ